MPEIITTAGEISINAIRYPIKRQPNGKRLIRRFMASRPTPRMVVGDSAATTHQDLSKVAWSDPRGGIGIERMDPSVDLDRCWWSTCILSQNRHLTLPPLQTITASSGDTSDIGAIGEYAAIIYAAFGTLVKTYSATSDAWSATQRTLGGAATSVVSDFRLDGSVYTAFAYTTGYDYYNGTTWATSAKDVLFLLYWRDRLWGIDNTGLLWSATTPGTETDNAQLPLLSGAVTNLFTARAPNGDVILYAATTTGLYAHDLDNQRWEPTEPQLPFHPDAGDGSVSWRDAAFVSAGLGVYRTVRGSDSSVLSVVGLDRDHGLIADYRGRIISLTPTLNALIAAVDATAADNGTNANAFSQAIAPTVADVIDPNSGRSALMAWDARGWQAMWTSEAATLRISAVHISNAYDDYRVWWAHNQRVSWMQLPRDIVNPSQITDQNYALSSTHELPWFDADEENSNKLAVVVVVHTVNASSTETIAVRLRLNDDDTVAGQTTLGTISAAGHSQFILPNTTTPSGTTFRSAKLVLDLARGSTVTATPDVDRIELYFVRKEELRWGVSVTIEIPPEGHEDFSAEAMYENLLAPGGVFDSDNLIEVTWRDRDEGGITSTTRPYNYYMHGVSLTAEEESGEHWEGDFNLVLQQRVGF